MVNGWSISCQLSRDQMSKWSNSVLPHLLKRLVLVGLFYLCKCRCIHRCRHSCRLRYARVVCLVPTFWPAGFPLDPIPSFFRPIMKDRYVDHVFQMEDCELLEASVHFQADLKVCNHPPKNSWVQLPTQELFIDLLHPLAILVTFWLDPSHYHQPTNC